MSSAGGGPPPVTGPERSHGWTMAESKNPLVEMRSISKRYGGVQALQDVDLDIFLGEVHALVGDNAAGKSTLVKTLAGAVLKDAGTITFDGRPVEIKEPRDAKALGIETVYQDLALADNLNSRQSANGARVT